MKTENVSNQTEEKRIEFLKEKIQNLTKERKEILGNYSPSKLNRLDEINHSLPYLRTEIENLEAKTELSQIDKDGIELNNSIVHLKDEVNGLSLLSISKTKLERIEKSIEILRYWYDKFGDVEN